MKEVKLYGKHSNGLTAKVSDDDYELVKDYKWRVHKNAAGNLYAEKCYRIDGVFIVLKMHKLIMGVKESSIIVDHKDGDGLNNQRNNLRIVTKGQNCSNVKRYSNNKSSKYLGVHYHKRGKWIAILQHDRKRYEIYCKHEVEAALEYNKLAKQYHGEFTRPNIITEEDSKAYKEFLEINPKWEPDTSESKRCRKCNEYKQVTEFYTKKEAKDGLHSYCKICNYTKY